MLIELVDAVDEPVGIDRMGVRVEQDDPVVACLRNAEFSGLAMAMIAMPESLAIGQEAHIGLLLEPGTRTIPRSAIDNDDLVGRLPIRRRTCFTKSWMKKLPSARHGHYADGRKRHAC